MRVLLRIFDRINDATHASLVSFCFQCYPIHYSIYRDSYYFYEFLENPSSIAESRFVNIPNKISGVFFSFFGNSFRAAAMISQEKKKMTERFRLDEKYFMNFFIFIRW